MPCSKCPQGRPNPSNPKPSAIPLRLVADSPGEEAFIRSKYATGYAITKTQITPTRALLVVTPVTG